MKQYEMIEGRSSNNPIQELWRASNALFLELPESIANDVKKKIAAALDYQNKIAQEEIDKAVKERRDELIDVLQEVANGQCGELKSEFIARIKSIAKTALNKYKK